MSRRIGSVLCVLGCVVFTLMFAGCSGSTGGGDANENATGGEPFVSTPDSAGSLSIRVTNDSLGVSETSGFRVQVNDRNGAGVPNIRVNCDTEDGLALLEPATGSFLTGPFGDASGVIGCEAPASLQMACRLGAGGRRTFASVNCSGTIPSGFAGFPGAGGGGLFGGVGTDPGAGGDPGGEGIDGLEITRIEFQGAGDSTSDLDVTQDDCADPGDPPDPEPFSNDFLLITITNNTNQEFNVRNYFFTVSNINGATYTSPLINLNAQDTFQAPVSPGGGTVTFLGQLTDITISPKGFVGATASIPATTGFRNVTIRVNGSNDSGDSATLTGRFGATFANFNNCG